ncbi:Ift88 [Symbiodinium sp. CCMP2592]|nr:Ift88 [Symbiodinium sp. CCMP2592]
MCRMTNATSSAHLPTCGQSDVRDLLASCEVDISLLQRHAAHDAAISEKLAEFLQERAEQSANSLEEELERDGDILSCWQLLGCGVGLTSPDQRKSTDGYRPQERGAMLLAAEKLIPAAWLVFLSREPHGFWRRGFGSAQHASPTLRKALHSTSCEEPQP